MSEPSVAADEGRVLEITRRFKASRDLVFKAWTEPDQWIHWFGPAGAHVPETTMDLREGGRWRTVLRHEDGAEHICGGTFEEISPPDRLVMTMQWDYGGDNAGHETTITVDFVDLGNGETEMRFHQALFAEQRYRDMHEGGWSSSFEGLRACLEDGARRLI